MLRVQLKKYFPELIPNVVQDITLCASCNISLEFYFEVMRNWSDTERNNEVEHEKSNSMKISQNDFYAIAQYEYKTEPNAHVSKDNACFDNENKDEVKLHEFFLYQPESTVEEFPIKHETDLQIDKIDTRFEEDTAVPSQSDEQNHPGLTTYQCKNASLRQNISRASRGTNWSIRTHPKSLCIGVTVVNIRRSIKPILNNTWPPRFIAICVNTRQNLHAVIHQNHPPITVYQCEKCEYKTKYKDYWKKHLKIHQDRPQVEVYQCEQCEYKAKHKDTFRRHMIDFKQNEQLIVCGKCEQDLKSSYEFKLLCLSTDDSIDPSARGDDCTKLDPSYANRRECDLLEDLTKCHLCLKLINHNMSPTLRDDKEDVKFCAETEYDNVAVGTDYTWSENEDKDEIKLFESLLNTEECSLTKPEVQENFSVKYEEFNQDSSEVSLYQCEKCEFKTKYKYHLKRHIVKHQDPSEVTTYYCEKCSYNAKFKHYIRQHMVTHDGPSKETIYQCDKCEYKTEHKNYLKRHVVVHQPSSKAAMYQCEKCDYKAKLKICLRKHMVIHQDPSKITMYHCDKCDYKAKMERQHQEPHGGSSRHTYVSMR
ncbi:hypothetical protein NQ318_001845 [Aromia moschata]|uniref:C2H2-type domain-containing protein n=1 Tax=Aromia moschata TaxID=1265417 RepID=A0AAV8Z3L4_9CUCU|nr:hypothetical protein NQ318_001845 [Aromia moschata]